MRIICLLFIVISLLSAEEELYLKDYWKKLLHFEDEKSNVISDDFFLSDSYRHSLQDEFYSTIELLRGDNGKEVACNFPARYLWIKKHIRIRQ